MIKLKNEWLQKNGRYQCPFCQKEYSKSGICTHIWRTHDEGKNHDPNIGYKNKNRKVWNKGLTNQTDQRVKKIGKKISQIFKKQVESGTFQKNGWAVWTEEQKLSWSKKQSENNQGGKCKWFKIDGKKVQGTWELNLALKMNELNILWQRCKPLVYYKENKEKRYTPDFYLPEYNLFLEIKGFWIADSKEKMRLVSEQHPYLKDLIKIIEKDNYQKLLEIKNKKDFIGALADMVYASA